MGIIKTIWKVSSWWSALLWFLCGGVVTFIWGYIAFSGGSFIQWIIFLAFLVFTVYYFIKFLRFIFSKSRN